MPFKYESAPSTGEQEVPTEKLLAPHEQVQIDIESPLIDSEEMLAKLGLDGKLVAVVNADTKSFLIVDTRNTSANRDFLIVDESFSGKNNTGFKGIEEDKPLTIGRGHYKDRFSYPETVSRDHFEVLYSDDELFIRNLEPTNETALVANLNTEPRIKKPKYDIDDERTVLVEKRMRTNPNFGEKDETAPYGYYLNHPILGRASSSVDNGVYMGGSAREAIVVDSKSEALRQVYKDVFSELRQSLEKDETLPAKLVLFRVMQKVQEVMPYDGQKTEYISKEHYGDKLIGLSTYLKEHAGVCRHQGLLAAFIIEGLIRDGIIDGTVGVERNTVEDLGGTHAWAIYKTRSGGSQEAIVVDPAQSFVGTKAQAQNEGRWEYSLGTDTY